MILTELDRPFSSVKDFHFRQQLELGWQAKDTMLFVIRNERPSANDMRVLYPPDDWFIDPELAKQKGETHGRGHIGTLLVVGIPYVRRLKHEPLYHHVSENIIVQTLRRHDVRLSTKENYPGHARAAVEFFRTHDMHREINDIWEDVAYIIEHHSDSIQDDPDLTGIHARLQHEREIMQDLDASDLTRPGANCRIHDIQFRKKAEADKYGLPYITQLVRFVSERIDTGDAFEDQIQAGISLGLVRP
jgi:hypothetical protein